MVTECDLPFSPATQQTADFVTASNATYKWHAAAALGSTPFVGQVAVYPGDGFIVDIPARGESPMRKDPYGRGIDAV